MYIAVKTVEAQENYTLYLTFANGERRFFSLTPYLSSGIYQQLKNKDLFKTATVSFDTVCWGDSIDIDPETLYEESAPCQD